MNRATNNFAMVKGYDFYWLRRCFLDLKNLLVNHPFLLTACFFFLNFVVAYARELKGTDLSSESSPALTQNFGVSSLTVYTDLASLGLMHFLPLNAFAWFSNLNLSLALSNGDQLPDWIIFTPFGKKYLSPVFHSEQVNDISLSESAALLATQVGLKIVNVDDLSQIHLLGSYLGSGDTRGVTQHQDVGYLAAHKRGLHVVDLSLMASPSLIASLAVPGEGAGLEYHEGKVFMVSHGGGLHIIDVSNSTQPTILSALATRDSAYQFAFGPGNKAYIADDSYGVQVIDIQNISRPVQLSRISTAPGYAQGVFIQNDRLLVANDFRGVDVFNLTDNAFIGRHDTPDDAKKVVSSGAIAFIADGDGGVQIVNTTNAQWVGEYLVPGEIWCVTVAGERLYVGGDNGLQVFSTNPYLGGIETNPAQDFRERPPLSLRLSATNGVGSTFTDFELSVGNHSPDLDFPARSVSMHLDATYLQAFGVYDLEGDTVNVEVATTPADLAVRFTVKTLGTEILNMVEQGGRIREFTHDGHLLYVAFDYDGLRIFDISNPAEIRLIGTVSNGMQYRNIKVQGSTAFLTADDNGLVAFDVSNPAQPEFLGHAGLDKAFRGLFVESGIAYVAANANGLFLFNITDPANLRQISQWRLTGPAESFSRGVTVYHHHAFIADGGAGLTIVDVSDPVQPDFVGRYDTPGFAQTVLVHQGLVYVSAGEAGIQVIDIQNLVDPKLVRSIPMTTNDNTISSVAYQQFLFIANDVGGLQVLDMTVPAQPQLLTEYVMPTNFPVRALSLFGSYLYLSSGTNVFSIALPIETKPNRQLLGAFYSNDQGIYEVSVVATDDLGGNTQQSFTMNLLNYNPFPLVRPSKRRIKVGETDFWSASLWFGDHDNDTLRITASQVDFNILPLWINYVVSNASFLAAPGVSDVGEVFVRVTANDGNGGHATIEFSVEAYKTWFQRLFSENLWTTLVGLSVVTLFGVTLGTFVIGRHRIKRLSSKIRKIPLFSDVQETTVDATMIDLNTLLLQKDSLSEDDFNQGLGRLAMHFHTLLRDPAYDALYHQPVLFSLVIKQIDSARLLLVNLHKFDIGSRHGVRQLSSTCKAVEFLVCYILLGCIYKDIKLHQSDKKLLLDGIKSLSSKITTLSVAGILLRCCLIRANSIARAMPDSNDFSKMLSKNCRHLVRLELGTLFDNVLNIFKHFPQLALNHLLKVQLLSLHASSNLSVLRELQERPPGKADWLFYCTLVECLFKIYHSSDISAVRDATKLGYSTNQLGMLQLQHIGAERGWCGRVVGGYFANLDWVRRLARTRLSVM